MLSAKLYWAILVRHPVGEPTVGDAVKLIDCGNTTTIAHGTVVPSITAADAAPAVPESARTLRIEVKREDVIAPDAIVYGGGRASRRARAPRQTLGDIFEDAAASHQLEWAVGLVTKRSIEVAAEPGDGDQAEQTDVAATDGQDSADHKEASGFWRGDENFPIRTVLLDAFHGMDRSGDAIPKANTLREKFMSRLRDALFIVCPQDMDELFEKLRKTHSEDEIQARYASLYSWFAARVRRKLPCPQEMLAALDKLILLYTPTDEEPDRGFCVDTRCHFVTLPTFRKEISALRVHIAKGCLSGRQGWQCHSAPSLVLSRIGTANINQVYQ